MDKSSMTFLKNISKGLDKARKLWNPNQGEFLFGKDIADKAKRFRLAATGSVGTDAEGFGDPALLGLSTQLSRFLEKYKLNDLLGFKHLHYGSDAEIKNWMKNNPKGILASVLPSNNEYLKGIVPKSRLVGYREVPGGVELEDKLLESKLFKGFIPETKTLGELIPSIKNLKGTKNLQKIQQALDSEYGANDWILKKRQGAFGSLTRHSAENPLIFFGKDLTNLGGNGADWIVQKNMGLSEVGPVAKLLDKGLQQLKTISPKLHDQYIKKLNQSNLNEYRVHVLNGKVIPYASQHRGSGIQAIIDMVSPWRNKALREAETYAQKAVDALPSKTKGSYGMDIGISKSGDPFLIESNPFTSGGGSGFAHTPLFHDAYAAAIKGELPTYVKLRRAAWGGAGLAGAGGIGAKLNDIINENQLVNDKSANYDPNILIKFRALGLI